MLFSIGMCGCIVMRDEGGMNGAVNLKEWTVWGMWNKWTRVIEWDVI